MLIALAIGGLCGWLAWRFSPIADATNDLTNADLVSGGRNHSILLGRVDGKRQDGFYTARKSPDSGRKSEDSKSVPYTLEVYDRDHSAWVRRNYLIGLSIGVAGTAIASGLVYFLGWLVGWILAGFRQHRMR